MSNRTGRVVALATAIVIAIGAAGAAFAATGPEPTGDAAAKRVVIKKLKQIKSKVRKQLKKTPRDSISTAKIQDRAVTADKLDLDALTVNIEDGSITLEKLAPDAVGTAKIVDEAVTLEKLAADAVGTAKILDEAVTLEKLAPDAVGTAKILDEAVTLEKLAADAVDSSKIVDDSITAGDIDLSTINGFWRLGGNAGTDSSTDLLGTTDGEPLVIGVNDAPALRLEPASDGTSETPNLIGGTATNAVEPSVFGATISGGGEANAGGAGSANQVSDNFGTVGGGGGNRAGNPTGTTDDERYATVGGGQNNDATNRHATVAGGLGNQATGTTSTVAGGQANDATSTLATSLGGFANEATGIASTIVGGQVNDADGFESFVGGGQLNSAAAQRAVIGGGNRNEIAAGADFAVIPGGFRNEASGAYSFLAGRQAKNPNAAHDGVFMFADSTAADISSSGANQFIARADGGFFLEDATDDDLEDQGGFLNTATGAFLTSGGTWTDSSDANLKQDFERVSPSTVLDRVAELPVRSWSYEAEPGVRHIGPTAQDFHAAFGLGADDRHIAALDTNGVALTAIKALVAENEAQGERIERLERALRRR